MTSAEKACINSDSEEEDMKKGESGDLGII